MLAQVAEAVVEAATVVAAAVTEVEGQAYPTVVEAVAVAAAGAAWVAPDVMLVLRWVGAAR